MIVAIIFSLVFLRTAHVDLLTRLPFCLSFVGHNFGSLHDRLNLGCGLTHPYGHALQVPNQFRTVMAYSCSGGSVCPVIPFFSASGFRFRDISMGDATHDNARLIRENAPAVAAWRPTRTNTAPMAAPIPAQVPVAVPMQVPNAAPAAASPQASSMWCPNNASSKCPVGTNLMRRRRLIFFCTASCLTNELASSNEFRRWHCGGC